MLAVVLSLAASSIAAGRIVTAEAPVQEAINLGSLILAAFALLAAGLPAVINAFSKKVRGHSDIRDDATAENENLKRSADTAISLVSEARANAAQAVELVRGSLAIAQQQIVSLNEMIEEYKTLLAEARLHASERDVMWSERIANLELRVAERTQQRDDLQRQVDEKHAELEAAEETIREMTLSSPPRTAAAVASTREQFDTIVFPTTDTEEQ